MHDLVLRGGTVYDGLGGPGVRADVAVDGDQVTAVGEDLGPARRVLDVDGLAVAPGFLDPHSHSDPVPLMADAQPFKLHQGVTTEIVGNCGFSFAPLDAATIEAAGPLFAELAGGVPVLPRDFAGYLADAQAAGPTNHLAVLVGHNTLRAYANGMDEKLRPGALARMCELADAAFAAGAVGLSSGLIYPPGSYADTDELVALARVAHRWNRPYATHMRNEDDQLEAALDEAIEIATRARVRLQVSHCKVAGKANHGGAPALLAKLHAARLAGVDVRGDQYPYLAGGTFLNALLPGSAQVGGLDAMRARLVDPDGRKTVRAAAEDSAYPQGFWSRVAPADVLVTTHATRTDVTGRTLAELAGTADAFDTLCEVLIADPGAGMVITMMDEADVRTIMVDPLVGIGSDNGPPVGLQHPRTWGCFPKVLGEYVRERGLLTLPEAIRKMTSAIADQFGLAGRGYLGAGAVADVVVFDPATIGHTGTYAVPDVRPTGVRHVLLTGAHVIDSGEFTGARAGQVLRG
ncbi:N-acyl-D-amino-acid deacylase family protein [Catellatospora tritici]|uniref:N-acyl-D-amino-acid deacylase family protein n=1 Tax=Catellatospora tritici TaxID=2851566 RepID=UPI001C2D2E11|nr:amidohydrolase family protein [Catellatospora tritici]MBV1853029.1 amidohydrolase family protein [Catellatospora tritici]